MAAAVEMCSEKTKRFELLASRRGVPGGVEDSMLSLVNEQGTWF